MFDTFSKYSKILNTLSGLASPANLTYLDKMIELLLSEQTPGSVIFWDYFGRCFKDSATAKRTAVAGLAQLRILLKQYKDTKEV